jgi:hypothetical protein
MRVAAWIPFTFNVARVRVECVVIVGVEVVFCSGYLFFLLLDYHPFAVS